MSGQGRIRQYLEHQRVRHWWIESLIDKYHHEAQIEIGNTGFLNLRPFNLRGRSLRQHKHIIGTSGEGKSNLLATYFCELVKQGIGAALIDPHADLAVDCLHHLLDVGYFDDPRNRRKILYIDFGVKDETGQSSHFLPFNVLAQPYDVYTTARNVAETVKRVWPYLSSGAPQFENIFLYSVVLLQSNGLPLTEIEEVLSNRDYRNKLLRRVTDEKVISFFKNRYDEWGRDQPLMRESTLNKISLLTFSPVLRYSLSQRGNALDFRRLMDEGISVIFNLGGLDEETQKFLGSLLSIGFETAALSREDTNPHLRNDYHLILDEFSMFSASSEEALSRILSLTRKYHLYLALAHQTFSQISERLRGALQNTITISFRLGRTDAVWMAQQFGQFESLDVKHTVTDDQAQDRTHPLFYTPNETHESWAVELEQLMVGECYVKSRTRTEKVLTHRFPRPRAPLEKLRALEASYTQELMVPRNALLKERPAVDETGATGEKGGRQQSVIASTVYKTRVSGKRRRVEKEQA